MTVVWHFYKKKSPTDLLQCYFPYNGGGGRIFVQKNGEYYILPIPWDLCQCFLHFFQPTIVLSLGLIKVYVYAHEFTLFSSWKIISSDLSAFHSWFTCRSLHSLSLSPPLCFLHSLHPFPSSLFLLILPTNFLFVSTRAFSNVASISSLQSNFSL